MKAKRKEDKFEHRRIKVEGLSMFTRISTEAPLPNTPAVVLVHGLSVSSGYLMPTAKLMAPHYRVYVPDLPGFGRSEKPSHIFTVAELADALASWMEAVGLGSAIFLGNSLGCQIIVNLALRHPEKIERAVLVSPTMDEDARTIHQEAWRLLLDARSEPVHFLPVLLREYFLAGIPRTICTLRYAFEDPVEENLTKVQIPTLVVRGSQDPIVPQDWVEKVDSLLPKSQLVVVQGAGHAVNFNSPEQLVHIVRNFLGEEARDNEVQQEVVG